jgi:hypothetical protein
VGQRQLPRAAAATASLNRTKAIATLMRKGPGCRRYRGAHAREPIRDRGARHKRRSEPAVSSCGALQQQFCTVQTELWRQFGDCLHGGYVNPTSRMFMSPWQDFYRRLALEARERAALAVDASSSRIAFERVADDWAALAEWVKRRHSRASES